MGEVTCDALLISAPGSGHGKTSITAGLIRHHVRNHRRVIAFKVGPDFLDPMILERASGGTVRQLDLWMMGEHECRRLLYEAACQSDIIVVEGVIGLFDGEPSTADFAKRFGLPIAAVVNARGMAQTVHAIAHGLATFSADIDIDGYIINGVNSDRHETMVAQALLPQSTQYCGSVRSSAASALPSRHLGLHQPGEIDHLDSVLDTLADAVAKTGLIHRHRPVVFQQASSAARETEWLGSSLSGLRIAIAKDDAFAFLYAENVRLLESSGAAVCYFSPIADSHIPPADAVYLPGGYPELHAAKLANNAAMKQALHTHVENGGSIYAECGGLLYLLEDLTLTDGSKHQMCNLLPGSGHMHDRMRALGYQILQIDDAASPVRAHTFHYSSVTNSVSPSAIAKRRVDGLPGESLFKHNRITASYLHVYFPNSVAFAAEVFHSSKEVLVTAG
jgi:cobyrinic acid a,c-diamide synthase